jgi:hypothetical protein
MEEQQKMEYLKYFMGNLKALLVSVEKEWPDCLATLALLEALKMEGKDREEKKNACMKIIREWHTALHPFYRDIMEWNEAALINIPHDVFQLLDLLGKYNDAKLTPEKKDAFRQALSTLCSYSQKFNQFSFSCSMSSGGLQVVPTDQLPGANAQTNDDKPPTNQSGQEVLKAFIRSYRLFLGELETINQGKDDALTEMIQCASVRSLQGCDTLLKHWSVAFNPVFGAVRDLSKQLVVPEELYSVDHPLESRYHLFSKRFALMTREQQSRVSASVFQLCQRSKIIDIIPAGIMTKLEDLTRQQGQLMPDGTMRMDYSGLCKQMEEQLTEDDLVGLLEKMDDMLDFVGGTEGIQEQLANLDPEQTRILGECGLTSSQLLENLSPN